MTDVLTKTRKAATDSAGRLRILGRANSFNVRKVLWVCDEIGIEYTREDFGRGSFIYTVSLAILEYSRQSDALLRQHTFYTHLGCIS